MILFAKNQTVAGFLSKQLTTGIMNKCYYAVAAGVPVNGKEQGVLVDYLMKDTKTNSSCVTTKDKGKESKLEYTLLKQIKTGDKTYALYDIHLLTGRHHQIRVQMSYHQMPLLGDAKYGSEQSAKLSEEMNIRKTALLAYRLVLKHPKTGKIKKYELKIPDNWQ